MDEKGNILNNGDAILNKGFNTISILPIVNVDINDNKLKKLSFATNKASDGNIYLGKGEYKLKINNEIKAFNIN